MCCPCTEDQFGVNLVGYAVYSDGKYLSLLFLLLPVAARSAAALIASCSALNLVISYALLRLHSLTSSL